MYLIFFYVRTKYYYFEAKVLHNLQVLEDDITAHQLEKTWNSSCLEALGNDWGYIETAENPGGRDCRFS